MVYKVKANWEACLASRKSKLSVFTTCLYGKRTHQRACLEKRLREWARVHLLKFDRFFCSAFGAKPTKKIIVNYCCTHRCPVKFTVPCMRLCLDRVWRFCP